MDACLLRGGGGGGESRSTDRRERESKREVEREEKESASILYTEYMCFTYMYCTLNHVFTSILLKKSAAILDLYTLLYNVHCTIYL